MTAIGVDVGGTYVKFFAVEKGGRVVKTRRLETDMRRGPENFLKQISGVINEWKEIYKGRVRVGIGMPGDVDNKNGVLRFGPNLKYKGRNITNLRVADGVEKFTGIRPVVVNDASAAAWGIYEKQLKKKFGGALVITMGTGIGGGLILNGALFNGSHGTAGEIGHTKISLDKNAPLCGCGARGCVEAYAGTYGIKRLADEEIKKRPGGVLAKLVNQADGFKPALVFQAAEKGCESALKVWETVGQCLGAATANAALTLDLDAVVFTGGVSRAHKYFMPALKKRLAAERIRTPFDGLKIFISRAPEAGGPGAALYALNNDK